MLDTVYKKALIIWLLFTPIAILNGIIRNLVYQHYVGELTAHQISTLTGSVAFFLLCYLILNNTVKDLSSLTLIKIGTLWVLMTIIFEFGFGHIIDGASWIRLLNDYNIFKGRIWLLFLITMFLTPLLVKNLYHKMSND